MIERENRQFVAIIPARYASTRFPGKPLAMIGGKPMIQRVFEQVSKALDIVYVATDDDRIYDCVVGFGGKVVMTSANHASGTDRCAEAAKLVTKEIGREIDVVVNVQGDEPFIEPEQIELIKSCFSDESVSIATLIREVKDGEELDNPNQVKVVKAINGDAIYFSRSVIPFIRGVDPKEWATKHTFYKHLGIYAYSPNVLFKLTSLPKSTLESAESLEQNRWIENGFKIRTAITEYSSIGIDTIEDLQRVSLHI